MPKPTLGYPSQTAAARALHRKGKSNAEIAFLLKISASRVATHLSHRQGGMNRSHIIIEDGTLDKLMPEAESRDLTAAQLASRLLRIIASDNLITAVLDDGAGEALSQNDCQALERSS